MNDQIRERLEKRKGCMVYTYTGEGGHMENDGWATDDVGALLTENERLQGLLEEAGEAVERLWSYLRTPRPLPVLLFPFSPTNGGPR